MWRVVETRAHFRFPPLAAQIDLLRPDLGLAEVDLDGCPHHQAHLLHVRSADAPAVAPPRLQDHYLRGADLIACYQQDDDPAVTRQLYWRAVTVASPAVGGVELIVSVQTSRLDSNPRLVIGSQLEVEEVLRLVDQDAAEFQAVEFGASGAAPQPVGGYAVLLYRLPATDYSYVEMIHPADCTRFSVGRAGHAAALTRSQFQLFDEHLEKGVIRRGRLRGVFVPRAEDLAAASSCYRRFVESALPLTA